MSRFIVLLFALCAMLFGNACVPSVHGIATEGNLKFLPDLVGSWIPSDDGQGAWVFESEKDQSYMLTLSTPEGVDGTFYAALVELEGELFLDLFPNDNDPNWPIGSFYGLHFLPVHTFMHVELTDDSLSLRMMDPSWMDGWLASNPDSVSHEKESYTLLTASTAELQALLPKLLDEAPIAGAAFMGGDATAFTDPAMMKRGEMSEAEAPVAEDLPPVKPMPTTQVPTTP